MRHLLTTHRLEDAFEKVEAHVLTHPEVTSEQMAQMLHQAVRVIAPDDLDTPMHFAEPLEEEEMATNLQHEVQKISQMYDEERQRLDLVMKLQQARQVRALLNICLLNITDTYIFIAQH